jgi:signal transduction histidine kinase
MFTTDEEIIATVIASAFLMLFLIVIVVIAVVRYQNKLRIYLEEISNMKIAFQEEILNIQNEMEEQTFQRISEEIHDNIGQILSLAKVNLHTLKIEQEHPALKQINIINDLVGKAINDLRQLSKSLNSSQLSQQRLYECVKYELELMRKTGVYSTYIVEEGEIKEFDSKKQLIIFRIIQEVLNNIMKHSKAKKIDIKMLYGEETLSINIKDDGVGFDVFLLEKLKLNEKGTGIGNIYRRSKLLGAQIDIKSGDGKGTQFELNIPYQREE